MYAREHVSEIVSPAMPPPPERKHSCWENVKWYFANGVPKDFECVCIAFKHDSPDFLRPPFAKYGQFSKHTSSLAEHTRARVVGE